MKKTLHALTIAGIVSGWLAAQVEQKSRAKSADQFLATVQVLAFDTRGLFLGTPTVRLFESEDHKDLASAFHAGPADRIPFGVYKLEAYMNGFYPEVRYVAIYQPRVTVIVGLPFGREVLTLPVPPMVEGKLLGSLPRDKKYFAKLIGIYSNRTLESNISADGRFDFSVPWDGRYLLLVVSEDGVLATRTIDVPYTGPALEIKIADH
jgi:hypothetical protein